MNTPSIPSAPQPSWWQRIYSPSGRARRLEYGLYLMAYLILSYVVFEKSQTALMNHDHKALLLPGAFCFLFGFLPYLLATIRRLHDFNQNGIWALLCFMPIVGQIAAIVLLVIEGNRRENRYGPNPKPEEGMGEMKSNEPTPPEAPDDELPNPEEGL